MYNKKKEWWLIAFPDRVTPFSPPLFRKKQEFR